MTEIEDRYPLDNPDYVWPAPTGDGWIDAWNGWYATEAEARGDAHEAEERGRPHILKYGEDLYNDDSATYQRMLDAADAAQAKAGLIQTLKELS